VTGKNAAGTAEFGLPGMVLRQVNAIWRETPQPLFGRLNGLARAGLG